MKQLQSLMSGWKPKTVDAKKIGMNLESLEAFERRINGRYTTKEGAMSTQKLLYKKEEIRSGKFLSPGIYGHNIEIKVQPRIELQWSSHFEARFVKNTIHRMPGFRKFLLEQEEQEGHREQRQKKVEQRLRKLSGELEELHSRYEPRHTYRQMKKLQMVFQRHSKDRSESEAEWEMGERQYKKEQAEKIKREVLKESTKEVTYIVQKNMKEQLNVLADKVYVKMEDRLRDELRRRGR